MTKKWFKFSFVLLGLSAVLASFFVIRKNFVEEPKQQVSVEVPKKEIQEKLSSSTTLQSGTEVKKLLLPVSGPDIPVHEYWDYAKIQGKHIYVNNTDRNVIYALNDAGKIQWVIWGKDYGFSRFEIRIKKNYFFVTSGVVNKIGKDELHLWVFGLDGKLRWQVPFLRGADIPQMQVTEDNKVIIAVRSQKDCGLPSCIFFEIQAFDLDSGTTLWRSSDQLHSNYLSLKDGEKTLEASSGGIGMGRFIFNYSLDTATGLVNNFEVRATDREYSLDTKELVYQSDSDQLLYRTSWTTNTLWFLKAGDPLFDLVKNNLNGEARITVLRSIILTQQKIDKVLLLQGFSKVDGMFLWKKELPLDAVDAPISVRGEKDILVLNIQCSKCKPPEDDHSGFLYTTEIWGVSELNGQTIWKYKNPRSWAGTINPETNVIAVYYPQGEISLDLFTGTVK